MVYVLLSRRLLTYPLSRQVTAYQQSSDPVCFLGNRLQLCQSSASAVWRIWPSPEYAAHSHLPGWVVRCCLLGSIVSHYDFGIVEIGYCFAPVALYSMVDLAGQCGSVYR